MPSSKRERTSQKKKEKVIEKTMKLLLRKGGSDSVSTSDVCAVANLTRSSLYHYFGSKTNLMVSVHVSCIEKTLKPYMAEAAGIKDPFERLTFMVRTFTSDTICRHPELRILIHDELTIKDKYFSEVRAEWKKHYFLLRDTIAELQSRGTFSLDVVASWAALFVLGMLTWITYWFDYRRKDQIVALGDAALRMVLQGLGAKGPLVPSLPEGEDSIKSGISPRIGKVAISLTTVNTPHASAATPSIPVPTPPMPMTKPIIRPDWQRTISQSKPLRH